MVDKMGFVLRLVVGRQARTTTIQKGNGENASEEKQRNVEKGMARKGNPETRGGNSNQSKRWCSLIWLSECHSYLHVR
jgi:hypothetical protein